MKISSLIEQRGDIHHIFPRKYLVDNGFTPKQYNQVANFVYTEQSTNIKVGKMPPSVYLAKVREQIEKGIFDISTLDREEDLHSNLLSNDVPTEVVDYTHLDYNEFLSARRKLMAKRIKHYYESL